MGGMRRSTTTGTLVIISDHTKGLYDDKWYGDELHYTGMGKNGDQIITGNQKDDSGNMRKVWMFPLSTSGHTTVTKSAFDSYSEMQEKKAEALDPKELEKKAREHSTKQAAHRSVVSNTYIRDPYVAEYAKERAHGICQLCGQPAPFNDKEGKRDDSFNSERSYSRRNISVLCRYGNGRLIIC